LFLLFYFIFVVLCCCGGGLGWREEKLRNYAFDSHLISAYAVVMVVVALSTR
jgi:hypothetical protein